MKKAAVLIIFACMAMQAFGKPEGPALKVFQFPQNAVPRIDGDFSDWSMVPDSYIIGTSELQDDSGKYDKPAPETLDIKVKVGWVKVSDLILSVSFPDKFASFGAGMTPESIRTMAKIVFIIYSGKLDSSPTITIRPQLEDELKTTFWDTRSDKTIAYQAIFSK